MSSKQSTAPAGKVLRIGIFQNKNCLEERLMVDKKAVYLGQDFNARKNTFVVPVASVPASFHLFGVEGGKYTLRFTKEMSGRVSVGGAKAQKLDELMASAKSSGGAYQVAIDEKTFGRVAFGSGEDEVAILFQFVKAPKELAKPVLPANMRGGLVSGIRNATTLAATVFVSAVLQGGFVGFTLSRDWPKPKNLEYQIPDRFVKLAVDKPDEPIEPEEPEEPEEPIEGEGDAQADATPEPARKPSEDNKPEPTSEPKSAEERAAKEAERKRLLSEQVKNKTILSQIGAISADGSGGSLIDTLTEGAGKTSMEQAFAGAQGVTTGAAGAEKSGLRTSGSAGADGKGAAVGIGDLGATAGAAKAKAGVSTGDKAKEKRVKIKLSLNTPEKTVGGKLDGDAVSKTLKRRSKNFQACFEREAKKNPGAGGKVIIQFTIGATGRVTQAKAVQDGVGGGVGKCVAGVIERLKFPRPKGGDVIVKKTFVFTSQG